VTASLARRAEGGRARPQAARGIDELLPHALGVVPEDRLGAGAVQAPEAAIELLAQLTRTPQDEADEVARVVRRLLDQAVECVRGVDEEQLVAERHRSFPWRPVAPGQRYYARS
jgi:hypothetical protein